jgi:hypothetical protein
LIITVQAQNNIEKIDKKESKKESKKEGHFKGILLEINIQS